MDVTFRMPAEPGERYMEGCLDDSVGTRIVVKAVIGGRISGVLRGYRVEDDGASLEVTLGLSDEATSIFTGPNGGESLGRVRP